MVDPLFAEFIQIVFLFFGSALTGVSSFKMRRGGFTSSGFTSSGFTHNKTEFDKKQIPFLIVGIFSIIQYFLI